MTNSVSTSMKLIVTIDTEEDNWGQYDLANYGLENIKKIDALQTLFDRYDVKPTYLVTYPVATDNSSISLLRGIMEDGRCEIGTHCHPWTTPPFEETRNVRNSMLCNLPNLLQYQKISTLHKAITHSFGIEPTSFRVGRFGFDEGILQALDQLGYKVDSSIMAFQDWEEHGGPDSSNIFPHVFDWNQKHSMLPHLLEVPATTGFTQKNFHVCNLMWRMLGGKFAQMLHLRGLLDRLGMLDKVWLSPETSSSSEMIRLTDIMMQQGYKFVNMFFHSTALKAGLSPFVKTISDEVGFLRRIEEYIDFTRNSGIESIKLSDVPAYTMHHHK